MDIGRLAPAERRGGAVSKIDTGGPFHPHQAVSTPGGDIVPAGAYYETGGATMLDWFAANASEADIEDQFVTGDETRQWARYQHAIRMVAERRRIMS